MVMRYQPQGLVRLNAAHPLARALSFAWVASAPDKDLVSGKSATVQGAAPAKMPYLDRMGRKFIGTGSLDFGNFPGVNFAGASQQTVFAEVFIPDTSASAGGTYIFGRVSSAWDYHLQVVPGNQQFVYATGGSSSGISVPAASATGGLLPYQGRPVAIAGTYDKVTQRLYVDGKLGNSAAQSTSFSTSSDSFAVGARGGGNQSSLSGVYVGIVLLFKRTLTDSEIFSLSQNPWQLFVDPYEDDEIVAAAVPTGITGSLSWSEGGETASLSATVTNTASLAWAETGDSATLAAVVTDNGSLAWTEDGDAVSIAATALNRAALAWSEAGDSASLVGAVNNPAPSGVYGPLAWAEAGDSAAVSVRLTDRGTISYAEQDETCAITGTSALPPVINLSYVLRPLQAGKYSTVHLSS